MEGSIMTQLPKEMTENGIHYTLHGDYFLPDLTLPEDPKLTIGRYGRMRKAYFEEHRPGLYEQLLLSGRLSDHLAEIDRSGAARLEAMIPVMAAAEGGQRSPQGPGSNGVGCGDEQHPAQSRGKHPYGIGF